MKQFIQFSAAILLAIIAVSNVHAQHYDESVPLSRQFTNNQVPGMQYKTSSARAASKTKPYKGSSLAHSLRLGTETGMRFLNPGSVQKATPATRPSAIKPDLAQGGVKEPSLSVEPKAATGNGSGPKVPTPARVSAGTPKPVVLPKKTIKTPAQPVN